MKRFLNILCCLLLVTTTSMAQYKDKIVVFGTASMVSNDRTNWGLEVSGKLVVPLQYKSFGSRDGKFFVVHAKDGKMGVCNAQGKFIFPCKYFKTTVVGTTISVVETSGAKPKFYNTANPTVEVVAKEMSAKSLEEEIAGSSPKGTYFNPSSAKQVRAVEQSKAASAAAPFGAFSFRTNSKNKQELVVDDKVVFTADNFNLITDAKYFEETKCWFFVVENDPTGMKSYRGLIGVEIMDKDGEKAVYHEVTIPIEYSFIEFVDGSKYWLNCSKYGGGRVRLSLFGKTPEQVKEAGAKRYNMNLVCKTNPKLRITQVMVGSNFTEIFMEYSSPNNTVLRLDSPSMGSEWYRIVVNGKQYDVKSTTGDMQRFRGEVFAGRPLKFGLVFDKLPEGTTMFDLMEGERGRDHFRGIVLSE